MLSQSLVQCLKRSSILQQYQQATCKDFNFCTTCEHFKLQLPESDCFLCLHHKEPAPSDAKYKSASFLIGRYQKKILFFSYLFSCLSGRCVKTTFFGSVHSEHQDEVTMYPQIQIYKRYPKLHCVIFLDICSCENAPRMSRRSLWH